MARAKTALRGSKPKKSAASAKSATSAKSVTSAKAKSAKARSATAKPAKAKSAKAKPAKAKSAKAKSTTAKPAKAKPATAKPAKAAAALTANAVTGDYPFPFYGEGIAEYFEWCEMHVWFAKKPSPADRKAIVKGMPKPLAHSVDWDGPAMNCGNGDQHANLAIREAYPPKGKDRWASTRQLNEFEADIRDWLVKTHAKFPIAFVARREDHEAGGTQVGAWHRWSMERIAEHYARVDAQPATIVGIRAWSLAVPLQLASPDKTKTVTLPPQYTQWLTDWYARR